MLMHLCRYYLLHGLKQISSARICSTHNNSLEQRDPIWQKKFSQLFWGIIKNLAKFWAYFSKKVALIVVNDQILNQKSSHTALKSRQRKGKVPSSVNIVLEFQFWEAIDWVKTSHRRNHFPVKIWRLRLKKPLGSSPSPFRLFSGF